MCLRPTSASQIKTLRQTHFESLSLFVVGRSPLQPNATTWAFGLQVKPNHSGKSTHKAWVCLSRVEAPVSPMHSPGPSAFTCQSNQTAQANALRKPKSVYRGLQPTSAQCTHLGLWPSSKTRPFRQMHCESLSLFAEDRSPRQPNALTWAFGLQVKAKSKRSGKRTLKA